MALPLNQSDRVREKYLLCEEPPEQDESDEIYLESLMRNQNYQQEPEEQIPGIPKYWGQ